MDVKFKESARNSRQARDNFLVDAVRPPSRSLGVGDGFKFGIGFATAGLLMGLIIIGLAWVIVITFKLHI